MIEKEARIHMEYTDGRRSSPEPSVVKRRAPAITLEKTKNGSAKPVFFVKAICKFMS